MSARALWWKIGALRVPKWKFVPPTTFRCADALVSAESDGVTVAPKLKAADLQLVVRCRAITAIVHRTGVGCSMGCK